MLLRTIWGTCCGSLLMAVYYIAQYDLYCIKCSNHHPVFTCSHAAYCTQIRGAVLIISPTVDYLSCSVIYQRVQRAQAMIK